MGGAFGPGRPSRAPCASAAAGRARPRPRPVPPSSSRSTWSLWGGRVLGFLPGALVVLLSALLLAGLALPGAAAQAAQGRAKQLPKCATVTETGSCRVRRYLPSHPDLLPGRAVLVLRNPTVTLKRDGEEAVEVSPKRFSRQWAATYRDTGGNPPLGAIPTPDTAPNTENVDGGRKHPKVLQPSAPPLQNVQVPSTRPPCTFEWWYDYSWYYPYPIPPPYEGTLREETYKKSKKTGTEKLRCKLDGLDAEIVDDLVGLPGPVPCTLKFQTPCFRGERPAASEDGEDDSGMRRRLHLRLHF